jgi:HAD superfamily hydrolase (TIGR01484 family)
VSPRLVALDIDGTLIDFDGTARPAVLEAVQSVVRSGTHVVLSTGRSVFGIVMVLDQFGLTGGYAVASNGAVTFTYHPVTVRTALTFDPEPAVRAALDRVPNALVAVEVIGRGYRTNRHFPEGEINGEVWLESVDELVREPVTRVIIRDPQSSVEEFVELAADLGLHGTNYYVGYTAWLDLAPEGVSKASALADVAEELDVDQADVLAIGDGRNDVEMLAWAGRGVAMGQAPDEVKDVADAVTDRWEQDGVAVELGRWFDLETLVRPDPDVVATDQPAPTSYGT